MGKRIARKTDKRISKKLDKKILETVKKYLAEVGKHYKIDGAYLFGSHAEGTNHEESDIDVAILLDEIKSRFQERINLSKYCWGIDTRIEPHPIETRDYKSRAGILANEIFRTGVKII